MTTNYAARCEDAIEKIRRYRLALLEVLHHGEAIPPAVDDIINGVFTRWSDGIELFSQMSNELRGPIQESIDYAESLIAELEQRQPTLTPQDDPQRTKATIDDK